MRTSKRLGKKFCVFGHLVSRTWHLELVSGLSWFLVLSVFARMLYGSFKVYDDPQTEIGFKWDSYLVW